MQDKHPYLLATISTVNYSCNKQHKVQRPHPTPSSDKDIVAKANDIIQFQGDVLLVRNPHIIDKGLQERSTGMFFD